jgi:hypothetical protein
MACGSRLIDGAIAVGSARTAPTIVNITVATANTHGVADRISATDSDFIWRWRR